MAWAKGGTTTLASSSTEVNVESLEDKKFHTVIRYWIKDTTRRQVFKFNDDATIYAGRWSDNGAESNESAAIGYPQGFNGVDTNPHFTVEYVINIATEEKLAIGFLVAQTTAGAANAPSRQEYVGKHDDATNPISQHNLHLGVVSGNGEFLTDSNVSVIGTD